MSEEASSNQGNVESSTWKDPQAGSEKMGKLYGRSSAGNVREQLRA